MFGYTSMQNRFKTYKMHLCYANYYCGTCFGLEHNYGQISRFLLSNDVALLGILLKCHKDSLMKRYKCGGDCKEKHCRFHEGDWGRMAAINLLLVNEKIKDDINDEKSWKARIARVVLGRKIRKAELRYPKMAEAIANGYVEMYALERQGSGIRPIEECFADMMVNTMADCRELEEWEIIFIRYISRWIYYIDALDDYEEDYKAGRFNSLKKEDAHDFYEYTRKYIGTICEDLQYIYRDLGKLLEMMPSETPEDLLLQSLIKNDIPHTTARVLSGRKYAKIKIRSIWEGSKLDS